MDRIESVLQRLVDKGEREAQALPQAFPAYLLDWWNGMIGFAKREVGTDTFIHKLIDTMQNLG